MAELEAEREENANLKKRMETLKVNFNEKSEAEILEYKQKIIDLQMESQQLIKLRENDNPDCSNEVTFNQQKTINKHFFKVIIEKCQVLEEEKSQLKAEFDNFKELAIATILDKDNEISNLKETHEALLEVLIFPILNFVFTFNNSILKKKRKNCSKKRSLPDRKWNKRRSNQKKSGKCRMKGCKTQIV